MTVDKYISLDLEYGSTYAVEYSVEAIRSLDAALNNHALPYRVSLSLVTGNRLNTRSDRILSYVVSTTESRENSVKLNKFLDDEHEPF